MRFKYDLLGGPARLATFQVKTAGTALANGAMLMRGATDDTNDGMLVVGAGALTDAVGVLQAAVAASPDSSMTTPAVVNGKVIINPLAAYEAEYSQASTDCNTGATSAGITFTLASILGIGGGWLYVVSGAAQGQLQYVTADANGSLTTLTAFSPVVAVGDLFIMILPNLSKSVALLTTDATKLASSTNAGGSAELVVLKTFIRANSIPYQELDPTKHSGLNLNPVGGTNQNPKFFAEVVARNHLLNALS